MKINEIIREKRLSKNMTQEQMASYLGVTAPAVNKWEKGASYPDITILPALARLLGTDLNTLLSFQEELTDKEIFLFLEHLKHVNETEGFEAAYQATKEKQREYPNCYPLVLNTALTLDGLLLLSAEKPEKYDVCRASIEELYRRVLESEDGNIRNQAQVQLFSRYMERKEYQKAEEILQSIPETTADKKWLQVTLYMEQGEFAKAQKLQEEQLLFAAGEVLARLMTLTELALKEERLEDAEYLAQCAQKTTETFDLWDYSAYITYFQVYAARRETEKCVEALRLALDSLADLWDSGKSPLYRHIKTKELKDTVFYGMQSQLLRQVQEDEAFTFLRESPEFEKIMKDYAQ